MQHTSPQEKTKNFFEDKKEEDFISEFFVSPYGSNKSLKILSYINEQINFFNSLVISRNILWKTYLDGLFPLVVLFNQINNKKLLKGIDILL